jgi:ATP-dependent Zn protease
MQQHILTIQETTTQLDRRLSIVEFGQADLKTIVQQLAGLQSDQGKKTALNEAAILAIKERTDTFAEHMEKAVDRLTDKQEDAGKKVASLETQMNVVKAIGAATVGAGVLVAIEHFFMH